MKYGHRLQVTVEKFDDKGRGMVTVSLDDAGKQVASGPGHHDALLAVPFTCPGDEADVVFARREYGVKVCELDRVIKPGPDRVAAPCPHAGKCGGCLWQHVDYKAQLAEKERGVHELFAGLGLEDKVQPIIPADQTLGYRNRMDYCMGWNGEVGLKEYGAWNKYVDIRSCLLMKTDPGPILQIIRDWMKEFDLQPWDSKFHSGDIRYILIRDGQNTNQRLVVIVIRDAGRVTQDARLYLTEKLNSLCSNLLLGQLTKTTDLSLAETFEPLIGEPWFDEEVNGLRYRIHPNSFFQTNTAMAARLQTVVLDNLKPFITSHVRHVPRDKRDKRDEHVTLLDLYCGLGFFGIAAAKKFDGIRVHGFELDEEAVKLASQNAETNGVGDQCQFLSGKAEDLSWKNIDAQYVILDPPRSGLHPRVIKTLLDDQNALQPRSIIYVSCNYHRLKDELPAFLEKFRVQSIQPLDMFPQTPHVEVAVAMNRIAIGS